MSYVILLIGGGDILLLQEMGAETGSFLSILFTPCVVACFNSAIPFYPLE